MTKIALIGEDVPRDIRLEVETVMGGVDDDSMADGPVETLTEKDLEFLMLEEAARRGGEESFLARCTIELEDRRDFVQSAQEVAQAVIAADGDECDMTITSVIVSQDWSERFHAGLRVLADAFRDRQRELGLDEVEFLVIQKDGQPEVAFL